MHVESGSSGVVAEGGQIILWCMSETSNPPVTILWEEDGKPIRSHHDAPTHMKGAFHGTLVRSEVILSADRYRHGHVITCTPAFEGFKLEELSQQFTLNVTCE